MVAPMRQGIGRVAPVHDAIDAVPFLARAAHEMRFGEGLRGLAAGQGWTVVRTAPPGARVAVDDELGVIAVRADASALDVARAVAREILRATFGPPESVAVDQLATALALAAGNEIGP